MNKTLIFMQADMHRAINSGCAHMEVEIRDIKELLAAVDSAEAREVSERNGQVFGWISPIKMRQMMNGKRFYLTVRRAKSEEFSEPVYCNKQQRKLLPDTQTEGIIETA